MKNYTNDPYWNLSIAILKRAVEDCIVKRDRLRHGRNWTRDLENDPEYYLFESEEEAFPSFLGICSLFNCSPVFLRSLIKTYLEERQVEIGKSSVEMLRDKFKVERVIVRKKLILWGWGKLRMNKDGTDQLLDMLRERKEIREYADYTEKGKVARFYEWVGG